MLKKILLLAAFAITPLLLSEDASAQCYSRGHGVHGAYRVPAYSHRVPVYSHRVPQYGHHPYRSGYRGYGSLYSSPYRYGAGYGYGGFGAPFYGRGTAITFGRGGFGLSIGF